MAGQQSISKRARNARKSKQAKAAKAARKIRDVRKSLVARVIRVAMKADVPKNALFLNREDILDLEDDGIQPWRSRK